MPSSELVGVPSRPSATAACCPPSPSSCPPKPNPPAWAGSPEPRILDRLAQADIIPNPPALLNSR